MFLNDLLRNFAFRLSLWYALIFALSTVVLLALVYYPVGSVFQRKDREIILAQLKEYATAYQAVGPEALRARASQNNNKSFYVHLDSPCRKRMPRRCAESWRDSVRATPTRARPSQCPAPTSMRSVASPPPSPGTVRREDHASRSPVLETFGETGRQLGANFPQTARMSLRIIPRKASVRPIVHYLLSSRGL